MTDFKIRQLENTSEVKAAVDLSVNTYNSVVRGLLQSPSESADFDEYMDAIAIVEAWEKHRLFMWGVFDGNKLLGASALTEDGHVTMLCTHPWIMRHGWGKKLVRAMRVFARTELDFSYITTNVSPVWIANILCHMGFSNSGNTVLGGRANYVSLKAKTIYEVTYKKRQLSEAFVVAWAGVFTGILAIGSTVMLLLTCMK